MQAPPIPDDLTDDCQYPDGPYPFCGRLSMGEVGRLRHGQHLRTARQSAGLTIKDAAARCGISAARLGQTERGEAGVFGQRTLARLAGIYGLPPHALSPAPFSYWNGCRRCLVEWKGGAK